MSINWADGDVKCPFYQESDAKRVKCEGLTDDSKILVQFRTSEGKNRQIYGWCASKYEACEIYRMIMDAKYKEE